MIFSKQSVKQDSFTYFLIVDLHIRGAINTDLKVSGSFGFPNRECFH